MSKRLRFLITSNPSPDRRFKKAPDTEVTFAPMDAIRDGLGGLDTNLTKPFIELAQGSYNYFEDGDLLLAKVTPCFENGKKALARGLQSGAGFATSEVHVIRPIPGKIDTRYLLYLLSSEDFRAAGMKTMTGSGGLRRISDAAFRDYRPQVTDLTTQRQIADFLDRETARIDLLIEKKQRMVELLEERLRHFTSRICTLGDTDQTLKRTGIDWWPAAPEAWRTSRIANLFSESKEGGEEGLPVLSVSINWGISDRELADEDRDRIVNLIEDRQSYKRVRPGDLVYNMMRAWQGGFGVAKVDGLVSPAYVVARPKVPIHTEYFEYLLRTPMCVEEFRRASKGIADFRQRLYWEHFRQLELALPPIVQQIDIARSVKSEKNRIEPIASATQESITRLREYRSALITAAVTGQIDPATHARAGATDRQLDHLMQGDSV